MLWRKEADYRRIFSQFRKGRQGSRYKSLCGWSLPTCISTCRPQQSSETRKPRCFFIWNMLGVVFCVQEPLKMLLQERHHHCQIKTLLLVKPTPGLLILAFIKCSVVPRDNWDSLSSLLTVWPPKQKEQQKQAYVHFQQPANHGESSWSVTTVFGEQNSVFF